MKLQTGLINYLPEFSLKPYAIGTVIKTLFSVLQNLKEPKYTVCEKRSQWVLPDGSLIADWRHKCIDYGFQAEKVSQSTCNEAWS
jgi:hypothetical protein